MGEDQNQELQNRIEQNNAEAKRRAEVNQAEATSRIGYGNAVTENRIEEGNDFVNSVLGETPKSQNDLDLNNYEETLHPLNVSNLNPGEVAPSIVVAHEKPMTNENNTNPSLADKMWKGNAQRYNEIQDSGISKQEGVSITEDSPSYKKYQEDLAKKREELHQEALNSNSDKNKGFEPLTNMSQSGQDFFARQNEIAEKAKADARHTDAITTNDKANEGFKPLEPMPAEEQDFLSRIPEIQKVARLDETHQQALNSNTQANEGFNPLVQNAGTNEALGNQAKIVAEMRAKNAMYEEARQSNINANKGFTADHFSGTEALAAQNEIVKGLREDMSTSTETTEAKNDQAEYIESLKADNARLLERITNLEEKLNILLAQLQRPAEEPTTQIQNEEPVTTIPETVNSQQMSSATVVNINGQPSANETIPVIPTNPQIIDGHFEESIDNAQGTPEATVVGATQQQTFEQQAPINQDERVAALEAQLRELRGENTPEQRSAALGAELTRLEQKLQEEGLTEEEKARYFDLSQAKKNIDGGINRAEAENTKKRERKEKIIKVIAGVAGLGLALATPAVGVAAVVAVTLGGRFVGNLAKKASNKLMSKSSALKYESRQGKSMQELNDLDKKIKRNEWWGKRLGEASAVIIGGSVGYGIGSALQNIFGWGAGSTTTNAPTDLSGQASVSHSPVTPEGSIELPQGGGIETAHEGVLVQDGRVNLPGSAWNGNLGQGPAQDILQGGPLNHSNYNGGIHEMAAHTLEDALVDNGVTRPELMENLNTSQVHQLLNRYLEAVRGGTPQPDLTQMLNSVKPGVAETLLK